MKVFTHLFLFFFIINPTHGQFLAPDANAWVPDGQVHSVAVDNDYTYISGEFNYVGPNTGGGAKLTTTSDDPVLTFPSVSSNQGAGQVNAVVPDGSGGWYIGGYFTKVGNQWRSNLARINSDGTVNTDWNPGANGSVFSIAVDGSSVYVGGNFSEAGGQPNSYFAKLTNTTGSADGSFTAQADDIVRVLAVNGDYLYVGGHFNNINTQERHYLAKLDKTTGTVDGTWVPNPNDVVYAIAFYLDGINWDVYVGGNFNTIGGLPKPKIALLNDTNGSADGDFAVPFSEGVVRSIIVNSDYLYIGGGFVINYTNEFMEEITVTNLAKITRGGTINGEWRFQSNSAIYSVAETMADLFIAGLFTNLDDKSINYAAKISKANGGVYDTWQPNPSGESYITSVSGTDVYLGGNFVSAGGVPRKNLARISHTTKTADLTWAPELNSTATDMVIDGASLYLAGYFTTVNGTARGRGARISTTDGSLGVWDPVSDAVINTIVTDGVNVYAGGPFTQIGGESINRLAKLNNSTGAADATWNPNPNLEVLTIALLNNNLYAGGYFTSIGGQSRNYIARIPLVANEAGNADGWNPNSSSIVMTLMQDGSNIYAGGIFSNIGGQARPYLARLSPTTGLADEWNPAPNDNVFTLADAQDYIYAGGAFLSVGGVDNTYSAKIRKDNGITDASWNPQFDDYVDAIAVNSDDIYLAGRFKTVNLSTQSCFALFSDQLLPVELSTFTASAVNGKVTLNWQTATEVNNYGFEIERMLVNRKWEKIGFVKGAGNSNSPKEYTFADNTSAASTPLSYRLKQIDNDGKFTYSKEITVELSSMPAEFSLSQNYPNPFNPATTIRYSVPVTLSPVTVSLVVYNLLGQEVATLVNTRQSAGNYEVKFNASGLSSGVYLYKLQAGEFSAVKKLILLK